MHMHFKITFYRKERKLLCLNKYVINKNPPKIHGKNYHQYSSFYVGLQFLDSVVISEVCETGCDKDYCA